MIGVSPSATGIVIRIKTAFPLDPLSLGQEVEQSASSNIAQINYVPQATKRMGQCLRQVILSLTTGTLQASPCQAVQAEAIFIGMLATSTNPKIRRHVSPHLWEALMLGLTSGIRSSYLAWDLYETANAQPTSVGSHFDVLRFITT